MDERCTSGTVTSERTREAAASGISQSTYATAATSVKRLSSQIPGGYPVTISNVVTNRYVPISRINTHPAQGSSAAIYGLKRPPIDYSCDLNLVRKFPRSTDKSKGLRHFSTKVCEKVKEKGHTNYNEVADELVAEYFDSADVPPGDTEKQQYDMKNIRRRVYDALNVLMAMNIIEKERKEIRWVGLPTSSVQECRKLEEEKAKRQERIRQKTEQLQELIMQLVAYKTLVERNRELERGNGRPREDSILYLPFIIVNTAKKTFIDCAISNDKTEYLFSFDQPFEIHDDIEVLKRLGLAYGMERGEVSDSNREKIKSCLPLSLRNYVDQIADGTLNNTACDIPSNTSTSQQDKKQAVCCSSSPLRHGNSPALAVKQSVMNIPQGCQQQKRPGAVARVSTPVLPRSASAGGIANTIHTGTNLNFVTTTTSGCRTVRAPMQHYAVQQGGTGNSQQQQRGGYSTSSRNATYSIQSAGHDDQQVAQREQQQQQQYDEVYEEEENLGYD